MLPFLDRGESKRVRDRMRFLAPVLAGAVGVVALTCCRCTQTRMTPSSSAAGRPRTSAPSARSFSRPRASRRKVRSSCCIVTRSRGSGRVRAACNKCHVLKGEGERDAPDHTGFGSANGILGVTHDPNDDHYFGKTDIDDMKPMTKLGEDKLKAVSEFLFSLGHEPQDSAVRRGARQASAAVFKDKCMDCHTYEGDGAFVLEGPDMTGYGSRTWLIDRIKNASSTTAAS